MNTSVRGLYCMVLLMIAIVSTLAIDIPVSAGQTSSINNAINSASAGDTITLAVGTYAGCNSNPVLVNKLVHIRGAASTGIVIDCYGLTGSKAFIIAAGGDSASIANLTVIRTTFALHHDVPAHITIDNVVFRAFDANLPSKVYVNNTSARITIHNSKFITGGMDVVGGGHADVYNTQISDRSPGISVSGNSSLYGYYLDLFENRGAIIVGPGAVLRLNHSSFSTNTGDSGGAMITGGNMNGVSDIALYNCTFNDNTATSNGAAWYHIGHPGDMLSAVLCTFNRNTASGSGGSVYMISHGTLSLTGCNFDQNLAMHGGALYVQDISELNMNDVIFTSNSATTSGAAIYSKGNQRINAIHMTCDGGMASLGGCLAMYDAQTVASFDYVTCNASVVNYGGFIYASQTSQSLTVRITHSVFGHNQANVDGGVIHATGDPTYHGAYLFEVSYSTMYDNSAANGGVLYLQSDGDCRIDFHHVNATLNDASSYGGVIYVDLTTAAPLITINSSILSNNTAPNGAAVWSGMLRLTMCDSDVLHNVGHAVNSAGSPADISLYNAKVSSNSGYGIYCNNLKLHIDSRATICDNGLENVKSSSLYVSGSGRICGVITSVMCDGYACSTTEHLNVGAIIVIDGTDMVVNGSDVIDRIVIGSVVIPRDDDDIGSLPHEFVLPNRIGNYSGLIISYSRDGRRSESTGPYMFHGTLSPPSDGGDDDDGSSVVTIMVVVAVGAGLAAGGIFGVKYQQKRTSKGTPTSSNSTEFNAVDPEATLSSDTVHSDAVVADKPSSSPPSKPLPKPVSRPPPSSGAPSQPLPEGPGAISTVPPVQPLPAAPERRIHVPLMSNSPPSKPLPKPRK